MLRLLMFAIANAFLGAFSVGEARAQGTDRGDQSETASVGPSHPRAKSGETSGSRPPDVAPQVSVIIPSFNAAATLGGQLQALASQEYPDPWEVVVADNGSTDGTVAVAESYTTHFARFRVVQAVERRGPAHARNVGAREAHGDWLLFCDADDVVGEGWLSAIARALHDNPVVVSRLDINRLNPSWLRASRRAPYAGERLPYEPYLPHAWSSGLALWRRVFESVGGFDESMRYLEDTDLSLRVQLGGTSLHFAHDAIVHCRYQSDLSAIYRQARGYGQYGALIQKRYATKRQRPQQWLGWPLRGWKGMLRAAPRSHRREGRARLAWTVGFQVGRLKGSLKYRVLVL